MTIAGCALNAQEALEKFKKYRKTDPLQDIPPALLNSADIYDYVRVTGMMHPFDPSPERLKSASYEVPFLGTAIIWDDGKKSVEEITTGKTFKLKKNSIAFISPETVFRLPDYIALRFNFRITHVHRGLLLGTGPLVDPGFAGRILIPLHNLTSEDYELVGGEGLIWVEFTKLSPNKRWDERSNRPDTHFHPFPSGKTNKEPHYYFEKASGNRPIQSSIPGEVKKAKEDAESARIATEQAKEYVASIKKVVYVGAIIGGIALVLTLAGIIFANITLISNTNTRLDNIMSRLGAVEVKSEAKPNTEGKTGSEPKTTVKPDEKSSGSRASVPTRGGAPQSGSTTVTK